MTTLDIFGQNIIDTASNFNQDPSRWITIKTSTFFIVKTLSTADSTAISNIIDNVAGAGAGYTIIFDMKGNIGVYDSINKKLIDGNTNMNPIIDNTTTDFIANSKNATNQKTFVDTSSPGYCVDKNNIFSIPGLKWILHRDASKKMYLLYNPMHSINVANFYTSTSSSDLMTNLINTYADTFTVQGISKTNKTSAIFADPTCNCFTNIQNCVNDYAGFYVDDPLTMNAIGASCTCGVESGCSSQKYLNDQNNGTKSDSFLPLYIIATQKNANISNCNSRTTICELNISAAGGNVNIQNDSQVSQKCGNSTPSNTQAPSNTQPPSNTQSQPPILTQNQIIIGSILGGLLIILIIFILLN